MKIDNATLFKLALQQQLEKDFPHLNKRAFVPAPGGQQQAAGPGGMPIGPDSVGMPPGAPMDPAMMGGMPPGAPMDPAMMGGMPPVDPALLAAAAGSPPIDFGTSSKDGLTVSDTEVVDRIVRRTLDIVRETLEMVGKAKPREDVVATAGDTAKEQPPPAGPVTGIPGLPADAFAASAGLPSGRAPIQQG